MAGAIDPPKQCIHTGKAGDSMISFAAYKSEEGIPIYLQIVRYIKRGIIAGTVVDGDEVPSRRFLSSLLGVNPNTIQKAYAILESEGLMESRAGAKSYMRLTDDRVAQVREELLQSEVKSLVSALKDMGLAKETALALIEKNWE